MPKAQIGHNVPRAKSCGKYRHPETGASWSGRALTPNWLREQLAKGKQVSEFAI